jgi:metallophosphoesterase (TIGR00282 family)
MKILFIGEIVSKPGRDAVKELLGKVVAERDIDFVIANCENLAHGRGMTPTTLDEMFEAGINFITGGDHTYWNELGIELLNLPNVIRPINYPNNPEGQGYQIIKSQNTKILIINALGLTSFNSLTSYLDSPFNTIDEVLEKEKGNYDFSILDFHAESTSEKHATAFYFDGKIDAIVGTHTHVPTCDNRKLPNGSLYVTDVGMTGNLDSVLGVKKEIIINLMTTGLNQRFDWETQGTSAFRSVVIDTVNRTIDRCDLEINN